MTGRAVEEVEEDEAHQGREQEDRADHHDEDQAALVGEVHEEDGDHGGLDRGDDHRRGDVDGGDVGNRNSQTMSTTCQ
nr:hypothetical protein [Nannocystis sp.]